MLRNECCVGYRKAGGDGSAMRKLLSGIVFACLGIQAADLTIPANETVEVTDSTALVYNGVTADRYSLVRLGDGVTINVKAMDATYGLPQHFVANGSVTFDFSQCPSTPWFSGTVVTNGANAAVNVKLPGTELRLGTWRSYSPGTQFGNQQNYRTDLRKLWHLLAVFDGGIQIRGWGASTADDHESGRLLEESRRLGQRRRYDQDLRYRRLFGEAQRPYARSRVLRLG